MLGNPFEVLLADTPEAKRIHFNLRYQVYCEETGFEDLSQFPDKMEMDAYDDHSAHFIVRDIESGEWVAAMRLVLQGNVSKKLPVFDHCVVDEKYQASCEEKTLEISRLCILKNYRGARARTVVDFPHKSGRPKDGVASTDVRKSEAKRECIIMLSLVKAASIYGLKHNFKFGVALMSAPLARILRMSGFDINVIGPFTEFRGKRRPYLFNVGAVAQDMLSRQFLNSVALDSAQQLAGTESVTKAESKLSA